VHCALEPCAATSSKTTNWIVKMTEKFKVFPVGIVKKKHDSVAIVVHKGRYLTLPKYT